MAVCLAIAVPSWLLGKLVPVIGGPVFSIVIGMVIALLWTPGAACKPCSSTRSFTVSSGRRTVRMEFGVFGVLMTSFPSCRATLLLIASVRF